MHAAAIMPSPTAQTIVRQPLLTAGAPATTITMAGSQYSRKTRHRLERMSRDSQVLALDSTLFRPYIQGYSTIWRAVQGQAQSRSNHTNTKVNCRKQV
jgi:hypothetical protein